MPKHAFTKDEVETLLAFADTVIPAMTPEKLVRLAPSLATEVDAETVAAFAQETPSSVPEFRTIITETLPGFLSPEKVAELKQVLGLFRSRIAMIALSQSWTPFHLQPVKVREQIILSWKMSRIPTIRRIYDSLSKLCVMAYLRSSSAAHKAMLYDPVPATPWESLWDFTFSSIEDVQNEKFDAIIVGSGSGGGVAAKEFSEAGFKVLVLEKGQHESLTGEAPSEHEALRKMYHGGAFATSDYGDMAVVAGATFGGGSAVNWAACLQPPAAVRKDWAETHKLPYFKSQNFQADLDAVSQYMGVSPPTSQSIQNQLLLEGARRLGYQHAPVPQNNGGKAHLCNHDCANGCRSGGKKGGVHSWLIDAARNGSKFVTGVDVRRIALSEDKKAEGVVVRTPDGEVTLNAARVFVCGGSVESPALLLRSKINNPRIGASLFLHPTNYVYAVFPQRTYPTDGQILTSVVGELANLTPSGHGVRVETGIMQPAVSMALMQWAGGQEHKARLAKQSHMAGLIAIARDKYPGSVVIDKRGEPVVHYTVSSLDTRSVVQGTLLAAECMKVMGAEEIIVGARGIKPWKTGDDFDAWRKVVEANPPAHYGSAHQMGSNRMAASSSAGVCDPNGAVYGVSGLYVADASVLPSASGVNPMITTMAVARKIVRGVIDEIRNPSENVAAKL